MIYLFVLVVGYQIYVGISSFTSLPPGKPMNIFKVALFLVHLHCLIVALGTASWFIQDVRYLAAGRNTPGKVISSQSHTKLPGRAHCLVRYSYGQGKEGRDSFFSRMGCGEHFAGQDVTVRLLGDDESRLASGFSEAGIVFLPAVAGFLLVRRRKKLLEMIERGAQTAPVRTTFSRSFHLLVTKRRIIVHDWCDYIFEAEGKQYNGRQLVKRSDTIKAMQAVYPTGQPGNAILRVVDG